MKKSLKYLIIFAICSLLIITGVSAKNKGKSLFQADDNLKISDELNGTAFLAGRNIDVDKKINGIGFIAGQVININSDQEYLFSAASDIKIKSNIKNDTFLAAANINIEGNLGRDAYMAAEKITIDGNVERNIYLSGSIVELNGTYKGNVNVDAQEIKLSDDIKIEGTLKYNKDAKVTGLKDDIKTKKVERTSTKISFKDYLVSFINNYIHITMFAIVLIYLSEKLLKNSLKQVKDKSAKTILTICGKGFLILIGVPIIALMLLVTNLFTSVGIVGGIIYGILIYVSSIFTSYFIATELDNKYLKKNLNSYLLVIVGLFIISVLKIIPVIGAFVSLFSLLFGLGITGNMIIELRTNK